MKLKLAVLIIIALLYATSSTAKMDLLLSMGLGFGGVKTHFLLLDNAAHVLLIDGSGHKLIIDGV
jgi:hypothetical protein